MLLTVTLTRPPATDLGHLLHKHPERVQAFDLTFGRAHVFYPEVTEARCTAALLLEMAPVELLRDRAGGASGRPPIEQYVTDRPYVASSFLSVAIAEVFGSALAGKSTTHADLAAQALPLEARVTALPCRGGEEVLRNLFEPLGYHVEATRWPLDPMHPEWGPSRYVDVGLRRVVRLSELLAHLYVLIPVLDDDKHYWVSRDEVDKLLHRGGEWLAAHPERDLIVRRYLRHQRTLTREALARLLEEDQSDPDAAIESGAQREAAVERPLRLHELRHAVILEALKEAGARRVLDLGCGEGRLMRSLQREPTFTEIVGIDVSARALEGARRRLRVEEVPGSEPARVRVLQGALTYRDRRLEGFDAAAIVEVVEHLDPQRLEAFERVVFEFARPRVVLITTPNIEYNAKLPGLTSGQLRHADHRFEWTRAEFGAWVARIGKRFGYGAHVAAVGPEDPELGPPTLMAVLTRLPAS